MKAIYLPSLLILSITSAHTGDCTHLCQRKKYPAVQVSLDGKHIAAVMCSDDDGELILWVEFWRLFSNSKCNKISTKHHYVIAYAGVYVPDLASEEGNIKNFRY